jgi:hypothetical protein
MWNYFLSFWYAPSDGIYQRWYFFPLCLFVIFGTTVFIGAVPTRIFGHDIFFLLDNGWRAINGQRPHVDYTSPWGPVTFVIMGLGLTLSRYTVDGIGFGNALFGLLIGFWSYRLGRHRLECIPRILLSLYLVGLVVAPYSLGWGIFNTSHAMVYNRYGYALLGLVMLESFETAGGPRRDREEWIGGISSGAAVALVLFLKITYFFAAALLVGASILLGRPSRRRILGTISGFAMVSIVLIAYLDFDVRAILGDWKMAFGARSESILFRDLHWWLLVNTPYLFLGAWLGFRGTLALEAAGQRNVRNLLIAAVVTAADLLLLFSNQQLTELPLMMILCLLVVNRVIARNTTPQDIVADSARSSGRAVLLVGGVFFLFHIAMEFTGLAHAAFLKARPPNLQSVARFTEPRLVPLLLYDCFSEPQSNGRQYTTYVNEGISLLRENTRPGETMFTMDMMNPFPYAMGRRPAIGGIAAAMYRSTLSDNHRPSDDRFFGTVDIVMVPKQPASSPEYYAQFYKIYEPALHDRFRLAAESGMWYLYKRK